LTGGQDTRIFPPRAAAGNVAPPVELGEGEQMPSGIDTTKWIDVEGIRTRYFERGQGTPIVLVHGGSMGDPNAASALDDWAPNVEELSRSHRVIGLDRLGQGLTDNPRRDRDWSMRASIDHLRAFLKALDAGPCHVVGHADGGYAVCRLLVEEPALVTSAVIVASHTAATGSGRDEYFAALNPHAPGTRAAARAQYEFYSRSPDHIGDAWLDANEKIMASEQNRAARRIMNDDGLRSTVYQNDILFDRDGLLARLNGHGVARPVLVVWGYDDPVAPVDQSYQLYRLLAQHQQRCHLHIVNHAGHYSFRERPAEFNRVLIEFVDGALDAN
jgi:pimeloyl-ACP methyl ester carboxylesterase